MKNRIFNTAALHMTIALTLIGLNSGFASAMGIFNAEQNESLNLESSYPIAAIETAPLFN